jgi:hypothetical protein
MFGLFKNKEVEKVASDINKIHNKIFKLAKKNKNGSYSINKKVLEREFKTKKLKTTKNNTEWKISKKGAKWTMFVGEIVINYNMSSKNKDEFKASYTGTSTFPGYYFSFFTSDWDKKQNRAMVMPIPDNDNGVAVKNALVEKYGFEEF